MKRFILIIQLVVLCHMIYGQGKYGGGNGSGYAFGSASESIVPSPPLAPVATAATGVGCNQFDAHWNSSTSATSYEIDVATDAGFSTILASHNTLNLGNVVTFTISGLSVETAYFYRLRALNNEGASINSNTISVTTTESPDTPVADPATGIGCDQFDANWIAANGAVSYEIDVASDASFSNILASYNALNVGNVLSVNISGLSSGTDYYYRIRSQNNCGESSYSNTIMVSTLEILSPPSNLMAIEEDASSYYIRWGVVGNADQYVIDVAIDDLFTNFVANFDGAQVSDTTVLINGLVPSTTYYVRIATQSSCGIGAYSSMISFATDNSVTHTIKQLSLGVVVTPNPSHGVYQILSPEPILQILVTDIIGEEKRRELLSIPQRKYSLDITSLPGGFYFVEVTTRTEKWLIKVMKN